tara:strand:+ start:88 stop:267 length:180 start_codon:yes stop_codon:yes gene_type:complete
MDNIVAIHIKLFYFLPEKNTLFLKKGLTRMSKKPYISSKITIDWLDSVTNCYIFFEKKA